jgi:hypothetical protein
MDLKIEIRETTSQNPDAKLCVALNDQVIAYGLNAHEAHLVYSGASLAAEKLHAQIEVVGRELTTYLYAPCGDFCDPIDCPNH